ncbi:MAG: hypothetical protein H7X94_14860, partial [Vallitaleaceae bacterium]|nr:hypothetical protein [Vallitaleaceae bacterium]
MILKKYVALFLVIVLGASLLVGCGKSSDTITEVTTSKEATKTEETTTTSAATEEAVNEVYKEATLSMLIDSNTNLAGFDAVAALAKEKLGITVEIELRPGGTDGDNVVKTR